MPKDIIEEIIRSRVKDICSLRDIPTVKDFVETDNLAEVIDKLIIVHIRCWMLEDLIHDNMSDADLASIKRKVDICFKQKRPKLIEAINMLIDKSVSEGRMLAEESIKVYKSVK